MSYALVTPCYGCKKEPECTDGAVLYGAQCAIHSIGSQKSHKGCGTIRLECSNKEEKEV